MSADLLGTIVAATKRTVDVRAGRESLAQLRQRVERLVADDPRPRASFLEALSRRDRLNVIAECKRRSPSKGVLRAEYDPVTISRGYAAAGAAAISVLTEPTYFAGSLADLTAAAQAVDVPLLRKDFVVDEYQVLETAGSEASALLLIVAALEDSTFRSLFSLADGLGLDVLVEVHTEEELERALATPARLIGVNNRNLKTLEVDLGVSERLIPRIPAGRIAVAESGFSTGPQVARLVACGAKGFLVGESLMTHGQPAAKMRELLAVNAPHP